MPTARWTASTYHTLSGAPAIGATLQPMPTASLRGFLLLVALFLLVPAPAPAQSEEKSPAILLSDALELAASTGDLPRFLKALDEMIRSDATAEELNRGGELAFGIAQKQPEGAKRAEIVARGIEALRGAIEKDPENFQPVAYLSFLLKMKAQSAGNESEAKEILAEADAMRHRSKDLSSQRGYLAAVRAWSVEVVQNAASGMDGKSDPPAARVDRAPFTIRVRLRYAQGVSLNASETDSTVNRMRAGFDFRDCAKGEPRFPCPGSGLAREENATWLIPETTRRYCPFPTRPRRTGRGSRTTGRSGPSSAT